MSGHVSTEHCAST